MDAPEPLVPPDLDLRDFRWMKLDLIALFNSEFNDTPDDTAWRAGVTLWGKAWHQVPAGSLPDDDARLCNMAGLGRDLKTWRRIRELALHGFTKCTDGRLYHRFLCEIAADAATERAKYLKDKKADRDRKKGKTSTGIPPEEPDFPPENGSDQPEFHRKTPLEGAERQEDHNLKPNSETNLARVGSLNVEVVSFGRSAPAAGALKAKRKEQLQQKLLRYCNATMDGAAKSAAITGLCGGDPENNEQVWFDKIDVQMRRDKWDDTAEARQRV